VRVSRNWSGGSTDDGELWQTDNPGMSYAIVWRQNGDPVRVGKLVVRPDQLVLEGADGAVAVRRELDYAGVGSLRIGRGQDERLGGRPVAVLESNKGTFEIASLTGRGELNEIVRLVEGALARQGTTLA